MTQVSPKCSLLQTIKNRNRKTENALSSQEHKTSRKLVTGRAPSLQRNCGSRPTLQASSGSMDQLTTIRGKLIPENFNVHGKLGAGKKYDNLQFEICANWWNWKLPAFVQIL